MEIIAKRDDTIFLLPALSLLCAAACIVLGFFTDDLASGIFISCIFGGIFVILTAISFVPAIKTPDIIIERRRNALVILGKRAEIRDVTDVKYAVVSIFGRGSLQLCVEGRQVICKNVRNVIQAFELLYRILRAENPESRPAKDDERENTREYSLAKKYIKTGMGTGSKIFLAAVVLITAVFVLLLFLNVRAEEVFGALDIFLCVCYGIFAVCALTVFAVKRIIYSKTPVDIIVRRGGELQINGTIYSIKDVRLVTYTQAVTRYLALPYGTLIVRAGGRTRLLFYADDVTDTANKLSRLLLEYEDR